jgi:hypothetical protein
MSKKKEQLRKIYLAIPYSGMEKSSYEQANLATVLLLNQGYNVFSPITHSHPLTLLNKYEVPHTWDYWQNIDYQFIDWADEVWVLIPNEGSSKVISSTGVNAEVAYARDHGMPVKYFQVKETTSFVTDKIFKKVDEDLNLSTDEVLNAEIPQEVLEFIGEPTPAEHIDNEEING